MINQNKEFIGANTLNTKQKRVRRGKVIKHFTIEIVDADSCPELKHNPSNPYSLMSDEERMRDLVDIFATLWAETCREWVQKGKVPPHLKKL